MYYHHFMTAIFDYVDKVIEIELIVPSQMHTKTLRNMRPLENKDSKSRTIVNSILFPVRKPWPFYHGSFL